MIEEKGRPDYLAELYVAGVLANAGWNVYFPHRDEGFDFVISKYLGDGIILRPVQVKGKYPMSEKTDKAAYGYVGKLSATHPEMVLAIPYFSSNRLHKTPIFTAYMPFRLVRRHSRGYRCQPACFKGGQPQPRSHYTQFFDDAGIRLVQSNAWSDMHDVAGTDDVASGE